MGLVGVYFAAKAFDKAFSSSGGGSGYNAEEERRKRAAERAKELGHVRKAMEAANGYEVKDGVEIPARVRSGVQRLFISKKRDIKHRSIVVLQADPKGVNMPETGVDLSKYSVVGVIDGTTLCLFEKETGDLLMMNIEADFDCGPHGDYNRTLNPIANGDYYMGSSDYDLRTVSVRFTRAKANGEIIERDKVPEEFAELVAETKERYPEKSEAIKFGTAIHERTKQFRAKQAEENANEEANQKQ